MNWYLDTSVALHALLPGGDPRARVWIDETRQKGEAIYSSTLLRLEVVRALRRERLDVELARPLIERIDLIALDDGIVNVAAAIEPHVRSLDAIHLATCSLLGFGSTVVTHDAQMASAARHLGLESFDPLA